MVTAGEVRVLIIDDSPDDAVIMRRLLSQYEGAHFVVDAVNSTGQSLPLLQSRTADLVFLDYNLPQENGISFMRRASGVVQLPPVVMVTGQGESHVVVDAIRLGAIDLIYKHSMTSQVLGLAAMTAVSRSWYDEQVGTYEQYYIEALVQTVTPAGDGDDRRFVRLTQGVGTMLGLNDFQLRLLRHAAELHDVSERVLPFDLSEEPVALNDGTFARARLHPLITERLSAPLRLAREVRPIIRHHHERWDGRGYIDGLAGEDIPLLARVMSVVDAYEGMTTVRPPRVALSSAEARERLLRGAGRQWDPMVTNAFLSCLDSEQSLALHGPYGSASAEASAADNGKRLHHLPGRGDWTGQV